jgi:hypothetical protein
VIYPDRIHYAALFLNVPVRQYQNRLLCSEMKVEYWAGLRTFESPSTFTEIKGCRSFNSMSGHKRITDNMIQKNKEK